MALTRVFQSTCKNHGPCHNSKSHRSSTSLEARVAPRPQGRLCNIISSVVRWRRACPDAKDHRAETVSDGVQVPPRSYLPAAKMPFPEVASCIRCAAIPGFALCSCYVSSLFA